MIYADQRWIGTHGIGRFARHVLADIDYRPIPLGGHPAAALDSYRLSRALKKLGSDDLLFSPGYNSPLFCPSPFIFTIHDLSHVYCPENSSQLIRLYYATIMKRACRRAAKILTVSEFTRRQIVEWSGISSDKVLNVSCGVDPAYRPEGESFGFSFPYLLCVSNRKKHKNEFRVVTAFAQSGVASEVKLVLTGKPTPKIAHHIEQQQIADKVHFAGLVDEVKMPSLYRGAEALVFPSLYEGFGLPVVEAMACGIPVITSNLTAMPEIAGDAALLVDPFSIEEIALAIRKITSEPSLRKELSEKGLARAAQFSWEKTAASVRNVLATTAQ